jgi:hypothetical protein
MLSRAISLMLFITFSNASIASVNKESVLERAPSHLAKINASSIQNIKVPSAQLLSVQNNNNTHRFALNLDQGYINIDVHEVTRSNRQTTSFSSSFSSDAKDWTLIYTQGANSGFGELFGDGKHLVIEQRNDDVFVVDVGLSGLTPGIYDNDIIGSLSAPTAFQNNSRANTNDDLAIVDIMLLYTQNIVDTYPNEMTQTLLEHLVFKANQTFFDSEINMRLRLVHTEFVDYPDPSSIIALNQLRNALDSDPATQTVPSLADVAELRNTFGADVVSMIRTHDLNEREVCGIAMFPNPDVDYLVNVSNVGISGGSNCIDTFTHEIGHNFGAGHQRVNNNPQGAQPAAGALIVQDKFNTMMSSIGTGDINRDFGLPVFSNPNIICATVPCGDLITANNAATINSFSQINAALRPSINETEVPQLFASVIDRDGDTVLDNNDAFPFNPSESADSDLDGVGDNADVFPTDPNEQLDTDQDGIGNNADTDDDNDSANDIVDALPLDPTNTVDADGDGVGANDDALDSNFQEVKDNDQDAIGDRSDTDDDNDGVADYFIPSALSNTEAWVVSAGNDSILRYDSQTGGFIDTLLSVAVGGFSFRSDAILSNSQQLFFIAFSDVLAFDRQDNAVRKIIDRSALATNFPAHLVMRDSTLIVNNGLGTSSIESFGLTANGNLQQESLSDPAVWRGLALLPSGALIIAERNTNRLLSIPINNLQTSAQTFSNQGLDKPEHIAIGNNSNIYVTNAGSKDISRFDSDGNYLGRFIGAGSGGLGDPSCLTIGPEGNIYVCSGDTNQVLKFDGQSGAFIEVFIDTGAGGLSQPVSLVFAGLPLDEFRLDGNHDSDGDLVDNISDDFPLDATETVDTDNDGIGNNIDTDDDNDTMPDTYEIANNLNPLNNGDAQLDNDSDGSSNLAEFQAGTNPNDANSVPATVQAPAPQSSGGSLAFVCLLFLFTASFVRLQKK